MEHKVEIKIFGRAVVVVEQVPPVLVVVAVQEQVESAVMAVPVVLHMVEQVVLVETQ
jgi:hypothetical protein